MIKNPQDIIRIVQIETLAEEAVKTANESAGPNDDRAICMGLQALTEAVLLLVRTS